ncbi:outer membrane receptor protein involved in Fe transport [Zymomonas mobilis]|uniref:TonB-dependent receptor n=1 Tax=Zymomonas mobilis TaxID=542 RepID=UPI000B384B36|nr:TonB-dependent receptor [Zymomonas mobilis]ART93620.1 TonB-dependent receptor [Zymomonas mobilis subsp. mobilis]TWD60334.1 outer membrane receptor protein involved in Fe transport [Zymomonas mobilis]
MALCHEKDRLLLSAAMPHLLPPLIGLYLSVCPSGLWAESIALTPQDARKPSPSFSEQAPNTDLPKAEKIAETPKATDKPLPSDSLPKAKMPLPSTSKESGEIIVTSKKQSDVIQNTGRSISLISGDILTTRNVNTVFDLQYQTVSLQVTPQFGSGQPVFAMRGVGFNNYSSNNASSVLVYIDGVANPVSFATNGMMFDIQHVEIARGAQGTASGRNTTGGSINYILNRPSDHYTGGISVQYGRFNATKIDGYISGGINDRLRFRLAGQSEQGGAWQHNDQGQSLGRTNRNAARLLFDYDANDSLTFELNLHGSYDRSDSSGLHLFTPLTAVSGQSTPADQSRYITRWGTSAAFAKEIGVNPNSKPFSHIDTGGVSFKSKQEFSFASLTNLFSYDGIKRREYDNFDASTLGLADVAFNTKARVLANEIRLESDPQDRLSWVGGLYYSHQSLSDRYQSGFTDASAYSLEGDVRYSQRVDTVAAFGQVNYHFSHKLNFIGGFRIEHESRSLLNLASHYISNGVVINPDNVTDHNHTGFTLPTGKVEIDYHPVKNDMLYTSFTRGIKSGGFTTNNSNNVTLTAKPFKAESVLAYEVGNKLTLPKSHFTLNVAGFYYDYSNQQIQSATFNSLNGGLIGLIVNAPRSHLYGGEIEATWMPIKSLTLSQSAGWAIGQYDRFSSLKGVQKLPDNSYVGIYKSRKGEALPFPQFTLNGSASYRWTIGDFYLTTGMNYSRRSRYHSFYGGVYNVPAYSLWGADITLSPKNSRWTVAIFGKNIFNKRYDVTRNFFISGDNIALSGMPATWGVRLSGKF